MALSIDTCCPRCLFCTTRCLCTHLPLHKFSSDLKVIVIQDHAERKPSKKVLSSIPILSLLLNNVEVVLCAAGSFQVDIDLTAYNLSTDAALLYPSEASMPISDLVCSKTSIEAKTQTGSIGSTALKVLLVLDGSWVTVQHMLARNTFLHPSKCSHIRLPPSDIITASVYHTSGLRREPATNFVSTAEAVAWAIHFLSDELKPATTEILRLFRIFVSLKIAADKNSTIITNQSDFEECNAKLVDASCSSDDYSDNSVDGLDSGPEFSYIAAAGGGGIEVACTLLPSCGVRYKRPISKTDKRKRIRNKEKRRKR